MTEGSMEHEGRIMKGIAGFYYVDDGKDIYECKARGLFRKTRVKPLPGDFVRFSVTPDTDILGGYVEELLPRKNSMIRPEAANVDQVFLVFSASSPDPNTSPCSTVRRAVPFIPSTIVPTVPLALAVLSSTTRRDGATVVRLATVANAS